MDVNFRYVFVKKGALTPETILENTLWIDVGNTNKDGVFDHHQDGGLSSAFECVMKQVNSFKGVTAYLKSNHKTNEVVIYVHEYPDYGHP